MNDKVSPLDAARAGFKPDLPSVLEAGAAGLGIEAGDTTLDPVVSSLPGEWDPDAGHYIPRMAVMRINNDQIFNVLAKIGLAEVDAEGDMVEGTEQFDVYGEGWGSENLEGQALLESLDEMNRYHIIFIPCMSQELLAPGGYGAGDVSQLRIDNTQHIISAYARRLRRIFGVGPAALETNP